MYYYLMYWHSKCYLETNKALIVVWSVSIYCSDSLSVSAKSVIICQVICNIV